MDAKDTMIEGVAIKWLHHIPDERGYLMEMLRDDDDFFEGFGQVYLTTTYPGVIKAWHYHREQIDYLTCVSGMIKLVLFDARPESLTYGNVTELFMGVHRPMLVKIPKLVYHGFKGIGKDMAIIINVISSPYNHLNPDEHRVPYDTATIPYQWELKHG